jgi:hypothetical protein
MGALSKLIFGGDSYYDKERHESITPEPAVLEVDMSEADFSNRNLGPGGAIIIAAWITHKDRGALSVANVMGNKIGKVQLAKLQEIMRAKPSLVSLCGMADDATEADLSGLGMDADDAAILASELPDKGALSVTNVMGNKIGKEQLAKLQEIMRSKPNLVSLCGIADDATEADLSGLNMDADDAIVLASELPDKEALLSLNLASNNIGAIVGWKYEKCLNPDYWYQHTQDGRHQNEKPAEEMGKPEGVIALANAIPIMGALSLLNLTDNNIEEERVQKMKEICVSRNISLLIN